MEATYRATCRTQFTKLCNQINIFLNENTEQVAPKEEVTIYLHRLRNAHSRLKAADLGVAAKLKDEDLEKEYEVALDYDDKAVALIAKLEFKLDKVALTPRDEEVPNRNSNQDGVFHSENYTGIKLKAIDLMKFDGKVENWLNFWEQFKHAVHDNQKIHPATKFSFLSQSLVGKASATIAGFTPSEKCYNDAIALLTEEYGDNDKIVEKYIQRLLNIKEVQSPHDVKGLRNLYNEINATVRTLSALNVTSHQYDIIVKSVLLRSIPANMRIEFYKSVKRDGNMLVNVSNIGNETVMDSSRTCAIEAQLKDLINFIKAEVEALEKASVVLTERETKKNEDRQRKGVGGEKGTAVGLYTSASGSRKCVFCKTTNHSERECNSNMSVEQRKQILKRESRCFRCAGLNHSSKFCKSQWMKCAHCNGRHLTSMCESRKGERNKQSEKEGANNNNNRSSGSTKATSADPDSAEPKTTTLSAAHHNDEIFLQTAKAILCGEFDQLLTRIVMDNGSQRTYVTSRIAKELNLPVVGEENTKIVSFGENSKNHSIKLKRVKVRVKNQYNKNVIEIIAAVVPTICADVLPIPKAANSKFRNIRANLADNIACRIELIGGINLLIGQDYYWRVNSSEVEIISPNLVAVNTFFGWTVQGGKNASNVECALNTIEEREEQFDIAVFWNLESIGVLPNKEKSNESAVANINFVNGRYVAQLPWKISRDNLNDNKIIAQNRLRSLTTKLLKDDAKLKQYNDGIQELVSTGVAEEVKESPSKGAVHYLPHRPVCRDDKTTTKMRIVFDASSSESGFLSLNEHLSAGENMVADLFATLVRFRSNRIAIIADIEKAFLQIVLAVEDRDTHRFLWYESPPHSMKQLPKIVEYRMTRVTFGVTSSPFLLAATIQKHLAEAKQEYAVEVCDKIKRSFYVDDFVCSVPTPEEATTLIETATKIMSSASFNLRKWNTNDSEVKRSFPSESQEQLSTQKVLGIKWYILNDEIAVDIGNILGILQQLRPTKRNLVRAMAKIYDPLGMLGPFTIRIKLILQDVWKLNIDWDQSISGAPRNEFESWQEDLVALTEFRISRTLSLSENATNEIHIFADASPRAYGAVAYMRSMSDEITSVSFICSRNRISPITKSATSELTVPKLELTAALIAARLKQFLLNSLECEVESVTLWSDSTIALNWIAGHGQKVKPYITARVTEINKITNIYDWRHCDGKSNPADLLTRGIKSSALLKSSLWKFGPSWLVQSKDQWPEGKLCLLSAVSTTNNSEMETQKTASEPVLEIEAFSRIKRLLRVSAYVFRFASNLRRSTSAGANNQKLLKPINDVKELTATELHAAEIYWVKQQQRVHFESEIIALSKQRSLPPHSKILSLNPIMREGILRVRSRLPLISGIAEAMACPAILSKRSWLSTLLIYEAHMATMHGGINAVLTQIRKKYWIIQARQLIKSILQRCVTCRRLHGKAGSEPWVTIPNERVMTARPFETTGIDYAGPLYYKLEVDTHPKKAYILLFTCAAIRAVHLELVPDMSANSFIEALRRFFARRGTPLTIISDNARTFKRADLELTQFTKMLAAAEVQQMSTHKGVTWKYIPERAAWWGGFWERLVRTVKTALKAAVGRAMLTYNELSTFLVEVESVVNARPLTYISSDDKDLEPLTPSHFLSNCSSILTDSTLKGDQSTLSRSWELRQTLMKRYTKRWREEYLSQLRSLYHNSSGVSRSIKVGDVVLLQEDGRPRLLWRLAVVQSTYKGRDGRVRTCDVRTSNNTSLKRPIRLLIPLEVSSSISGAQDVEN